MRDGFGMCLREIKHLGDKMAAVEKKVGIITNATASNDLQLTTESPPKRRHKPGVSFKVLGIRTESCVCLDVPFVCQNMCALFQ